MCALNASLKSISKDLSSISKTRATSMTRSSGKTTMHLRQKVRVEKREMLQQAMPQSILMVKPPLNHPPTNHRNHSTATT